MSYPRTKAPSSASVRIRLLDGGSFSTATLNYLHAEAKPADQFRMYDWCFLISHTPTGRHILWDVGLSSVRPLKHYLPLVCGLKQLLLVGCLALHAMGTEEHVPEGQSCGPT